MKAADFLEGAQLDDGWVVTRRVPVPPDATGGTFSVPYHVERSNGSHVEHGFLKALDFTMWRNFGVPIADAMNLLTDSYTFERDVVLACAGSRMKNVVLGIGAGEHDVVVEGVDPTFSLVPYIIFERADGDLRDAIDPNLRLFDAAFAFRVLHGVANGLRQLHQSGVIHQDIKASNVMTFDGDAKIGDFGRASHESNGGVYDHLPYAGDPAYAAPELLYGELNPDERIRRRASDVYQLGSLVVYLFTGTAVTPMLESTLFDTFHWRRWPNGYRNALPYVRDAFDRVITILEQSVPAPLSEDVARLVRQLSEPDPALRGTPGRSGIDRLSMERYVTHFDRLRVRAEVELLGLRA